MTSKIASGIKGSTSWGKRRDAKIGRSSRGRSRFISGLWHLWKVIIQPLSSLGIHLTLVALVKPGGGETSLVAGICFCLHLACLLHLPVSDTCSAFAVHYLSCYQCDPAVADLPSTYQKARIMVVGGCRDCRGVGGGKGNDR